MKCRLIVDALGPNPDFLPPDPKVDPVGFQLYDVPHSVTVPAGTELPDHPMAWLHCVPDAEDVIRAEPVDQECETMVERYLVGRAKQKRQPLERVRREHQVRVSAVKAQQERKRTERNGGEKPK